MIPSNKDNAWLFITLAAAAMLMITMGARQAQGLFVFPISGSTGVSIAQLASPWLWGSLCGGWRSRLRGHVRIDSVSLLC